MDQKAFEKDQPFNQEKAQVVQVITPVNVLPNQAVLVARVVQTALVHPNMRKNFICKRQPRWQLSKQNLSTSQNWYYKNQKEKSHGSNPSLTYTDTS